MGWTRVVWAVCVCLLQQNSLGLWHRGVQPTQAQSLCLGMDEWNMPSPRCPTWKQPSKNFQGGAAPQPGGANLSGPHLLPLTTSVFSLTPQTHSVL